jgi:murein tripeptide amidase MpaA
MPYLSVTAISDAVDFITTTYPAIASSFVLPEASVEGRQIRALKIAGGTGTNRTGVLFLGGTHARELVNPETVISFALRLCDAYTHNSGLAFGPKTYEASTVQLLVNALDIFLVPMVNPDGRHFCLMPGGTPMWRKNRAPNPGQPCQGVDLNRNCDFLWSSGVGTSASSCSDIFKGPSAFSEPETRNVRWLLDNHTNIASMIDIHSYSELVLYPWGDDDNQTTDPNQNFMNPAFDGQRGVAGSGYREYIPAGDLDDFVRMGGRIRDGIAAVRGRTYTLQQSMSLYPTTGTIHDYAYSRHFVDTGRRRVLAFTLETAREFQPSDAEKNQVIEETSAGLVECLLETMCPADAIASLFDAIFPMTAMRSFRDRAMRRLASGKRYEAMLAEHGLELIKLASRNKEVRAAAETLLRAAGRLTEKEAERISGDDLKSVKQALAVFQKQGSRKLQASIASAVRDMAKLEGLTLHDAFRTIDKRPGPAKAKKRKMAARTKPKVKPAKKRRARK